MYGRVSEQIKDMLTQQMMHFDELSTAKQIAFLVK